ncbi:cysteine--tRNA ligase [Candidatus Peregrinibacteria bacterium]|nr:MAG: cysteine--tRNA ligase [Candidatus Peregrinibacteria bacterium]
MIQFYDSLKGEKVAFKKKPGEKVGIYVCGPTVYDFAHLGHGRSAVAFDVIRRFLEFSGYEVVFTFNTTDIDDKMIDRAAKESIRVDELAERIIPEYKADYGALGVKAPTHNPRATEFVPQMISIIQTLEKKGCTYVLEDGVYFDITTFPAYGKLSHQKLEELNAGARVEERKDKRNHQDFVLWKFKKEGEPFWKSPWGDGRPGWHIECSAMSSTLLGDHFDIHGGGLDLKFPHHECELAQSEAASGELLADIWMHNGYITVDSEKMSKSLGNFFTLKEIFKSYHPRVVRFFLLGTHYRSPIEYSIEMLEQARSALKGMDEFYLNHLDGSVEAEVTLIAALKEKMDNDVDVAGALSVIYEWMKAEPTKVQATLEAVNAVLHVLPVDFIVSEEAQVLLAERADARARKDWAKSDDLRNQLAALGYDVEDKKDESTVRPRI